jgi:putative FmdB family regulatory protein
VPTYQYACTSCGRQIEAVQSFSDEPLTECPTCAGKLRKLFSSVGIVFKGSGFYRTDSRATAKSGGNGASSESPAKSDSKPEAKPAPTPNGSGADSSSSAPAPKPATKAAPTAA